MVRATYARVYDRLGQSLPPSWTETKISALCTVADYKIDGYTYPETISTTSNVAIEIAVDVVLNMMRQADMLQQSSGSTSGDGRTYPGFEPLTDEIKGRIDNLLRSSTFYGFTTVDMISEE